MATKRVNLDFDINDPVERTVYELLCNQRGKKKYICNAVLVANGMLDVAFGGTLKSTSLPPIIQSTPPQESVTIKVPKSEVIPQPKSGPKSVFKQPSPPAPEPVIHTQPVVIPPHQPTTWNFPISSDSDYQERLEIHERKALNEAKKREEERNANSRLIKSGGNSNLF